MQRKGRDALLQYETAPKGREAFAKTTVQLRIDDSVTNIVLPEEPQNVECPKLMCSEARSFWWWLLPSWNKNANFLCR